MSTHRVAAPGNAAVGDTMIAAAVQRQQAVSPRVVDSDALLAGASQLAILHKQTIYYLRQTRFGKLILTK